MNNRKQYLLSWTLMTLAAISVISANSIFVPSLSYIADELGTSEAVASSNMAVSRVCMVVCMFCFGAFADLFSTKRLMQAALFICILSCGLSAVAWNIFIFDVAQAVEAVSRAMVMLTMQLWIAAISNKDNLASRLSWYTILITIAPIAAPSVGGFVSDYMSWRYSFILLIVICGTILTLLSFYRLYNGKENHAEESESQDEEAHKPKARFAPLETLREYRRVLSTSPLLKLSFSLGWMAWIDGAYIAIVSFLFIRELGLSASSLGLIIFTYVAGAFAGRFPILYLQKHYGPRVTFLFHQGVILLATVGSALYYFLTGSHSVLEITIVMVLFGFGFSGMYIYCLRNSMVLEPEKKSIYTSLFNSFYSIASLIGVVTIQVLYSLGFTSIGIFQTLMVVASVAMIAGSIMHLQEVKILEPINENQ
ncbi:MAG: MFS transporter [Prevotella sp.]|nr:MFS transporter [Prevotella sp.]